MKHPITVALGDGIGPEIMAATLFVLEEAGAELEIEKIAIGEKVYLEGNSAGIEPSAWESLRRTKIFLKSPITTPQGGGYRSLNVTVRGMLGLYANVRPCISYAPFIQTKHPKMDVVIIRENEEDLYIGVEYQQTPDVYTASKLISRAGSERICRYAFEYAKRYGRKKVTCFSKDNILKLSDGHFHKVFDAIAAEYPEIENVHWIVDIGAAKLADTPEEFDVIVMPNLYGDILSDVGAQITGSIGLVGTANIGEAGAMFEAIHGSAPRKAGQNTANPTGLILASVLMLVHISQPEAATRLHNAWLKTIEDGIHTQDIFTKGLSKKSVSTSDFAKEIGKRVGKVPQQLKAVDYTKVDQQEAWLHHTFTPRSTKRELVGVDIYLYSHAPCEKIAASLRAIETPSLQLQAIFNRGLRVWPDVVHNSLCVDQWRCRFIATEPIKLQAIVLLQNRLADGGLDIIRTDNLYNFDDRPGYSNAHS
ncbi:MAG: NADP-dependent isocitrate dehydrogenase [Chlamydiales bacterium]